MKNILNILAISMISCSTLTTLVSCNLNPINGGSGGDQPAPPKPVPKDLTYYQNLLQQTNQIIEQFQEGIEEFINNAKGIDNFDKYLAELQAEQKSYLAVKFDCLYYILYLQNNGNFDSEQKQEAIDDLNNELTNLTEQLTTKMTYQTDYPINELNQIQQLITNVTVELAKYK